MYGQIYSSYRGSDRAPAVSGAPSITTLIGRPEVLATLGGAQMSSYTLLAITSDLMARHISL